MKRAVSLTALAGIVSMILGLGLAWLLLSPSYTEVISIRSDAGLVAIHEIGNVSATVSTPHRIVVKRPGDGASNSNVVMVADHVDTIKLMWASRNSLLICMDSGGGRTVCGRVPIRHKAAHIWKCCAIEFYLRLWLACRQRVCHEPFTQPRPEPFGHVWLPTHCEESPDAWSLHLTQRVGRLRWSGNLWRSNCQRRNGAGNTVTDSRNGGTVYAHDSA
jgi:hypothetical protein